MSPLDSRGSGYPGLWKPWVWIEILIALGTWSLGANALSAVNSNPCICTMEMVLFPWHWILSHLNEIIRGQGLAPSLAQCKHQQVFWVVVVCRGMSSTWSSAGARSFPERRLDLDSKGWRSVKEGNLQAEKS